MIQSRLKGCDSVIKFRVRVQLALKEINQKQLADLTGVRPSTISAICTGSVKHLPIDALEKICAVLDCRIEDIIEFIPDKESSTEKE